MCYIARFRTTMKVCTKVMVLHMFHFTMSGDIFIPLVRHLVSLLLHKLKFCIILLLQLIQSALSNVCYLCVYMAALLQSD